MKPEEICDFDDAIPPYSAYNMYYELHNGEEIDASGYDDDEEYIIDKVRFKEDKRNIKISYKDFSEVKDILSNLFESNDEEDYDFYISEIEDELEDNSVELKDIKFIHILFVGNDWSRNLQERERIDINLVNKVIETSYWEEEK